MRVLMVGPGKMGQSQALAHHHAEGVEIIGLINRSTRNLPKALEGYPMIPTMAEGLALQPDLVVIATNSDSHAELACRAMQAGAHVFVEKPLATSVEDAKRVVTTARETGKKLMVDYVLRHHPSWMRLIEEARGLGGPYVFRMNPNQQSSGAEWETHKALMKTTSPIVDCGVHYVDVWCLITDADKAGSADIEGHTKVGGVLVHRPGDDELIEFADEPDYQDQCDAQQAFVRRAIAESLDLPRHIDDAERSLAICLAADESIRTSQRVTL